MTEEVKLNTEFFPFNPEVTKAMSAAGEALVNIGNSQLAQSARTMAEIGERMESHATSMLKGIAPVVSAVTKSMQAFAYSESFQNMIRAAEQLQKVSYRMEYLNKSIGSFEINEELAEKYSRRIEKENLYDTTVEETKKSIEETGQPVPYKVFSNKFIFNVYIPTMGAYNTLSNASDASEISPEFVTQFIMFTLLPMIYFLFTMKEEKEVEIVFSEDGEEDK